MGVKDVFHRALGAVNLRVMRASRYRAELADRARETAEAVAAGREALARLKAEADAAAAALGERLATVERRLDAAEHGLGGAHARVSLAEHRVGEAEAAVRAVEARLDAAEHALADTAERQAAVAKQSADTTAAVRATERRLNTAEHSLGEARRLMRNVPTWFEGAASEPAVRLALADLTRPGDTAFDVGAHHGELTVHLARLVGPRGRVCAFEANLEVLAQLTHNCAANGLGHVHLTHAAVWHRTGEWLSLLDPGDPAAVAVTDEAWKAPPAARQVESLALDDYVDRYGLVPQVVKMDVEGAEKHALRGFARTLAAHRPHLVIEQYVGYDDALDYARGLGYRAFCTNQYAEVRTSADLLPGSYLRNLACVHADRLADTPFARVRGLEPVRTLRLADLTPSAGGWAATLDLPAGRYVATADATDDPDAYVCFQAATRRGVQGQYHERFERFASSCRDLPFDLPAAGPVTLTLFNADGDTGLRVNAIRIDRVNGYGAA